MWRRRWAQPPVHRRPPSRLSRRSLPQPLGSSLDILQLSDPAGHSRPVADLCVLARLPSLRGTGQRGRSFARGGECEKNRRHQGRRHAARAADRRPTVPPGRGGERAACGPRAQAAAGSITGSGPRPGAPREKGFPCRVTRSGPASSTRRGRPTRRARRSSPSSSASWRSRPATAAAAIPRPTPRCAPSTRRPATPRCRWTPSSGPSSGGRASSKGSATSRSNYEGYAPGGVAVIVETLTDNRNRTAAEIRNLFNRNGGSMAEPGAVSWQFERKGVLELDRSLDEDKIMEVAVDAGAEDLSDGGDRWVLTCGPPRPGRGARRPGRGGHHADLGRAHPGADDRRSRSPTRARPRRCCACSS